MSVIKLKQFLGDSFEIKNGIAGVERDIMFRLIKVIYFKRDELIQNLIGISGACVLWLNHFYFPFCRNPKPNLRTITFSDQELKKKKLIKINVTSIVFKMHETGKDGSVFLNILVKEMILECIVRIKFKKNPWINIGICTPSQLNKSMKWCIGDNICGGASLLSDFHHSSAIMCNGKRSPNLKEGEVKNEETIRVIINQNNSEIGGKMNFIRFGKKIPHTITNIPSSGVYFGFSSWQSSVIFHIESLHKLHIPSPLSSTKEVKNMTTSFSRLLSLSPSLSSSSPSLSSPSPRSLLLPLSPTSPSRSLSPSLLTLSSQQSLAIPLYTLSSLSPSLSPPSLETVEITTTSQTNENDDACVMRSVAYDFNGEFEYNTYNHRDEDGKEIPNIREYYK